MLEKELIGANFIVPLSEVRQGSGYRYREAYCAALKQGARIGHYDASGQFIANPALTALYQQAIPQIADALLKDTRSPDYQRFKLAALEKGTLQLHLEWRVGLAFNAKRFSLSFARLLRDRIGLTTLLVDLHGPSYEVIAPESVDALLDCVEQVEMVAA